MTPLCSYPQAHGAPLPQAGAKLLVDWTWANQALMACPPAQRALTAAAILTPSLQLPDARQQPLVVCLGPGSKLSTGGARLGELLGKAAGNLHTPEQLLLLPLQICLLLQLLLLQT